MRRAGSGHVAAVWLVGVVVSVSVGGGTGCAGEASFAAPTEAPPPPLDEKTGGERCDPRTLKPAAPSASRFMWQGQQLHFTDDKGRDCRGRIAAGLGDRAMCFVDKSGMMRCAGRIYKTDFGPNFVETGQRDVDQILLTATFSSEAGNAICVHKLTGTAWCMGDGNSFGAFGVGDTEPHDTFVQWGGLRGLRAISAWLCALDESGQVLCTGGEPRRFQSTPQVQPVGAGHKAFWVNTFGQLLPDDPLVFRAGANRPNCSVGKDGLECYGRYFGDPGTVVDGNQQRRHQLALSRGGGCWLTNQGKVYCTLPEEPAPGSEVFRIEQRFIDGTVLMLIIDPYSDDFCAVYNDASLHCMGQNRYGELGSGEYKALLAETEVSPPDSVRIDCRCEPPSHL